MFRQGCSPALAASPRGDDILYLPLFDCDTSPERTTTTTTPRAKMAFINLILLCFGSTKSYVTDEGWLYWVMEFLELYLILCLYNWIQQWRRLRHIKGPASASISRFWLLKTMMSGEMHTRLAATSQKYGKKVPSLWGPGLIYCQDLLCVSAPILC